MASIEAATSYPVHLGLWTNWSHGRVGGSTITLTTRNGAVLTAALAIFITFTGTSFWRIACFTIHQFFSTKSGQDGLYHQRQAVLRNAANESNGLISLFRISWAWRSRSNGLTRLVPLLAFALGSMALFASAGILCSKIVQMNSEVLVSSPHCGLMAESDLTIESLFIQDTFMSKRIASYMNYAQQCYVSTSVPTGTCGSFVRSQLPSTATLNASCPFDEDLCLQKYGNIRLETIINSHSDLGLNAPPGQRLTTKFVTYCAPLRTEGHKATYNLSGRPYVKYFYGPILEPRGGKIASNYSFQYEERASNQLIVENAANQTTPFADYSITTLQAFTQNRSIDTVSGYSPMEGLFQPDGDLTLIFLSADEVEYINEVNDDWYSAHQPSGIFHQTREHGDSSKMYTYLSDEPASPLGCKSQYQFCNDQNDSQQGCSQLEAAWDVYKESKSPAAHELLYWMWSLNFPSVEYVIEALGISSLTSRFNVLASISGPLPDNQWQMDVQNWHNIALAKVQGDMVQQAVGPGDANILENQWQGPQNNFQKSFCKNQKIRSTAYSNFSLLWLVVVLAIGILIILLDFTLLPIVAWVDKRRKPHQYSVSRLQWFTDDLLQLQRLAHEEIGLGTWSNCVGVGVVPVTEKGELLAIIDAQDPGHPRLTASSRDSPTAKTSSEEKLSAVVHAEELSAMINGDNKTSVVHAKDVLPTTSSDDPKEVTSQITMVSQGQGLVDHGPSSMDDSEGPISIDSHVHVNHNNQPYEEGSSDALSRVDEAPPPQSVRRAIAATESCTPTPATSRDGDSNAYTQDNVADDAPAPGTGRVNE